MKKFYLALFMSIISFSLLANERSIPLELFTAKEMQQEGKLKVSGPMDWKNPRTGETMKVYERKRGDKIQLFSQTNNGQCLGRVSDSRYVNKGLLDIENGCKFPLGNWKDGEKREFKSVYNYPDKSKKYIKSITIKKLGSDKKCMKFRWSKKKTDGKLIDDNSYTYCPKKGFTEFVSHN